MCKNWNKLVILSNSQVWPYYASNEETWKREVYYLKISMGTTFWNPLKEHNRFPLILKIPLETTLESTKINFTFWR